MNLKSLDNLVKADQLKKEPYNQTEFEGLLSSGKLRLKDADIETLSMESRFDLAYNSAHSLALAALRRLGYRSGSRYVVFQALPHTLGVGPEIWRVLSKCHDSRNLAEYEGHFEIDKQLFKELLAASHALLDRITSIQEQ